MFAGGLLLGALCLLLSCLVPPALFYHEWPVVALVIVAKVHILAYLFFTLALGGSWPRLRHRLRVDQRTLPHHRQELLPLIVFFLGEVLLPPIAAITPALGWVLLLPLCWQTWGERSDLSFPWWSMELCAWGLACSGW